MEVFKTVFVPSRSCFTILCIAAAPYRASRNLWGYTYVHPQPRTATVEAF